MSHRAATVEFPNGIYYYYHYYYQDYYYDYYYYYPQGNGMILYNTGEAQNWRLYKDNHLGNGLIL